MKRVVFAVCSIILLVAFVLTGCEIHDGEVLVDGKVAVRGSGEPVALVNNPLATNPTFAQLKAFLDKDQTDLHPYYEGSYVCTDFAETLYNDAEASGIRAAFVIVEFQGTTIGHALNAFETTDCGLIFIDCVGENYVPPSMLVKPVAPLTKTVNFGSESSWDKVAYVQEGKPLGFISLRVADLYGLSQYSSYDAWTQKKALFDEKLSEYEKLESEYESKTSNGLRIFRLPDESDEYAWAHRTSEELKAELDDLKALAGELGGFWAPEGTVNKVHVFWKGR
jgi:hypothetical protein